MAESPEIRKERHKVRTLEGDKTKTPALKKRLARAKALLQKLIDKRRKVPEFFDISYANGHFDFSRAKKLIVIRATEGLSIDDSQFHRNYSEARRRGLHGGIYHFGHPGLNDPIREANHFVDQVNSGGGLRPGWVPVLDYEKNNGLGAGDLTVWAERWGAQVRKRLGRRPGLYTYTFFDRFKWPSGFKFLWIADYRGLPFPRRGDGAPPAVIHQYTSTPEDKNRFRGSWYDARQLFGF